MNAPKRKYSYKCIVSFRGGKQVYEVWLGMSYLGTIETAEDRDSIRVPSKHFRAFTRNDNGPYEQGVAFGRRKAADLLYAASLMGIEDALWG